MNESNRRCSDSDPTGPEEIPDILVCSIFLKKNVFL